MIPYTYQILCQKAGLGHFCRFMTLLAAIVLSNTDIFS